ncbi:MULTISPECIES: LEA type 2 family protein [unclassified Leptospira]|uniref:NDR1/HIN1-like protein n=1 Tax=unclassified Leptospira TaxID=2633828 RepID=UPI0002BF5555|nr:MULTISPECIES: LEA type 2 family protein [unclassified Leptospira]EMJ99838.1 late embryogenesis abundant protein [Leptospira sp. B5-022]MCR1794042.1 LEA type 2 family protein [Leptospira sp. id769339]
MRIFVQQAKRPIFFRLLALVFGTFFLFTSCLGDLRENVKKLQACKFRILETKTERVEILPFPPSPKILMTSTLEIENPNDTSVKIYQFDLGVIASGTDGKDAELARVISEEETEVPAFSKTVVQLKIETSFEKRENQDKLLLGILVVTNLVAGKDPNLRMKGSVRYKTVLGEVDIPLDEKIRLLPKKPEHEI